VKDSASTLTLFWLDDKKSIQSVKTCASYPHSFTFHTGGGR